MSKPTIDIARALVQKRKFADAIDLLEDSREIYRESFEYYLLFGTACLYVGDTGTANQNFQKARHIKIKDTRLLLGQAALFLRRGDTDLAIQYYLDVLDIEPQNKIARSAMEFIRTQGNYETIVRWVDSGKIEKFYPPLGRNLNELVRVIASAVAGVVLAFIILHFMNLDSGRRAYGNRADLSELTLTSEEQENALETDLSGGVYRYILTDKQIMKAYDDARMYFQDYRDNMARVEVNRILNSNASSSIKKKADLLLSYFEEPTFDSITDNFPYADVAQDPVLYVGCWVVWSGRISNAVQMEDSFKCDLLVGYETLDHVDGIVPVLFTPSPKPEIEGGRPVKILSKIGIENGKISLAGRTVYQPVQKEQL